MNTEDTSAGGEVEMDFTTFLPGSHQAPAPSAGLSSPAAMRRKFNSALEQDRRQAEAELATHPSLKAAQQDIQRRYPSVKVGVQPRVSMKPPPGSNLVMQALIDAILTRVGAESSQTEIREKVQARFPQHTVTKNWTAALPDWATKKIRKRLCTLAPPFDQLKLPSKLSLSALHKAMKNAWSMHQTGTYRGRAQIEISKDTLIINGQPFKISLNKSKGHTYPIARVNVDVLRDLLDPCN